MNTITFDQNCNCAIYIPADRAKVSFLTNPLFTNNVDSLKSDIAHCKDASLKQTLEQFLKDLESGRFRFMDYEITIEDSDEGLQEEMDTLNDNDLEIVPDNNDDGNWMACVHDVRAEHTGFWYAAMNISREIQIIKARIHILSGYIHFADNLDEIIGLIRNSTSTENIFKELLKRGFSEPQARAVIGFRLSLLGELEKNRLAEEIDNCNQLLKILEEYV